MLYLSSPSCGILNRWSRNWSCKWVAGEERPKNVPGTIRNQLLVGIHGIIVFLCHQGCQGNRLGKCHYGNNDGVADILEGTLQVWNTWFRQTYEINEMKLIIESQAICLVPFRVTLVSTTHPAGIFPTILTLYSVLKLKKYDRSVPAITCKNIQTHFLL